MEKELTLTVSQTEIGPVIKAYMKKQRMPVVWLARALGCSRTNVYKIFEKHSIDTEMLMKISTLLGFDFFKIYSAEMSTQKQNM